MTQLPGQIIRQARKARMHSLVSPVPALIEVRRGVKEVIAGGTRLSVPAGGLVLLPEALAMTICNIPDAKGGYEARALPLPRVAIEAAMSRLPALPRPGAARPMALAALPDSAAALMAGFFAPSPFAGLPNDVLNLRLEELALWLALGGAVLPPPAPPRLSDRLRALIAADPAADWTATRAASQMARSPATLRRHLAAEGTSFAVILRDTRLTQALGMLQCTAFPVARIAAEVGYASPQQFAARFRARFGLAPHEIRLPSPEDERHGAEPARNGAMPGVTSS
ncbi:helix-turn-helix transcriptional regulator [Gemmobacter lutimaris]|nr:helix-turn-helix transcriptional regulator [Gemmobacter lutimaris]